jgi:hypothetical protein
VVVVPKPALRKSAIDDRETDRTPKGRVPLAPALCAAQLGVVEKPAQRPTASSRLRSATVMGGGGYSRLEHVQIFQLKRIVGWEAKHRKRLQTVSLHTRSAPRIHP